MRFAASSRGLRQSDSIAKTSNKRTTTADCVHCGFDIFVDPDDDSDGEPNLWVACDHDTDEVIQHLTKDELGPFYRQHSESVEYTSLLDEVQELASEERE